MTLWFEKIDNQIAINDTRYEGKNPNNYVNFNNELWRIIGVFDENTHDIPDKKLVKIVKDEPIGFYAFSNVSSESEITSSDWTISNVNKLLNEYYYNSLDGTLSNYCYGSKISKSNCNYKKLALMNLIKK